MGDVLNKVLEIGKKLGYFGLQYVYVFLSWVSKFIKIQLQRRNRASAREKMAKSYSGLGAEIYSLYKQGQESDWKDMPSVQQRLRDVEDAESRVFQVDETIEEINTNYLTRKLNLKEKYSSKREQVSSDVDPEGREY